MTISFSARLLAASFVIVCASGVWAADSTNWPRWRGPADAGSTESGSYPTTWDANTNVLWKIALPGKGCSTPIVWQDRIFVTAPIDGQDALLGLDSAGKTVWQSTFGVQREGKNRNGSGCNSSPATDGQSVFVYFKSGTLASVDMTGKLRWKTNLQERYGKDTLYWDIGTSPVLTDADVVVAVMHHGDSYLAAFKKLTGEVHWKVSRDYLTPVEGDHSYATPHVVQLNGRQALIVWGAQHLTAYDASDGKLLWSCGGFNPDNKLNWVVVASSVVVGDRVVIPYGRGEQLHGIDLTGRRVWERKDTGSFVPTPAAYKGRVYLLHDRGEIDCIDPADGKTLSTGKLPRSSANFYSSPAVADGKVYAAREDGIIFVASAGGAFHVLSQNDMGERVIASPVPINGRLLVRGEDHLFCIGGK
jgi:outer membrane protein assembly factor BamB